MKRFLLPLLVFGCLSGVLAASLTHDPRRLPSALIGKTAPDFDLPRLDAPITRCPPTRCAARYG